MKLESTPNQRDHQVEKTHFHYSSTITHPIASNRGIL